MTRGCGLGSAAPFLSLVLAACFDSRWVQEPASQKRVAAHHTPSALHAGDAGTREGAERKLRVRVYATRQHAGSVVDWQRQFQGVVRDANPTLRADFDVELEIVAFELWENVSSEDSLNDLLQRLFEQDPGTDVDWVVGLASAVPKLAESPDQIGMATTPGKHLVIRALSDPEEFDAIEQSFDELSEGERQKLYASRKRHKAALVLLHELGHTLGIPHDQARDTLMNARYSHKASDFSESAVRIGKTELARRGAAAAPSPAPASSSVPNVASSVPNVASSVPNVASSVPNVASSVPNVASSVPDSDLAGLSNDERRLFHVAVAQKEAKKLDDAWRTATPLFARHARVYGVQKLRCDLATAIGGAWEHIRAECSDFMKLPHPASAADGGI